jgi:hypothetical protein
MNENENDDFDNAVAEYLKSGLLPENSLLASAIQMRVAAIEGERELAAKSRKKYFRRIAVRMNDREHAELSDRAKKTDLSLSRYLIKAGLSDGQVLTAEEKEEIRQLRFELRKIGTNLNQIAFAFNASIRGSGDAPTTGELKEIQKKINDALETLLQFIKNL